MENELKPLKVGVSLGFVFALLSLICAILVYIAPQAMLSVTNNVFHGFDVSQIAKSSLSIGGVLIGMIEMFIIGLAGGWLFAAIYNKIN